MHEISPVTSGSDEDRLSTQPKTTYAAKLRQQEEMIRKWAGLWRSLTISSIGKTFYPYSQYIRALNLQDLAELLQDGMFRTKISDQFFLGDLEHLKVDRLGRTENRMSGKVGKEQEEQRKMYRLDIPAVLSNIGEVITAKAPMLEELRGHTVTYQALQTWVPKLPRLRHLVLWEGAAVRGLGEHIRENCPCFTTLKFWRWQDPDADATLATFFNDIRPQSLESLGIHSGSNIASLSFQALSKHCETLTDLTLKSLSAEAMQSLSLLKECRKLTTLSLAESISSTTDLEHRHNDIFLEVVEWLRGCTNLRSVQLSHFYSGPALLEPVLREKTVHIQELELDGYVMTPAKSFHRALAQHTSLRSLCLKGEGDDYGLEGYNILVDSLCQLENLTDLRLKDIADYFTDEHVCKLARYLPKLEVLVTGGWGITDEVFKELRLLSSLKMLQFNAITKFTAQGLMEFVLALGPGNMGFALSVLMSDMEHDLEPHERQLVIETLETQVKGRFEFMTMRGKRYEEVT